MKIQKVIEIEISEPVLPESVKEENLDTITADQWRTLSEEERQSFRFYWNKRGYHSFVCLRCGFPTSHGRATCEACN